MNDDRIIDEYKAIASGNRLLNPIIEIDVPDILRVKFEELISNIEIQIWDRLSFGWDKGFEKLIKYTEKNGHPNVPRRYVDKDGFKLGSWVGYRRDSYKKGKLSSKHVRLLEELPGWEWDLLERTFKMGLGSYKNM